MMRWNIVRSFLLLSLLFVACIKPPPVNIEITLETVPQPPVVGESELAITLTDADGTLVTGATLEVVGDKILSDMAPITLSDTGPIIRDLEEADEDGVYRIPFEWTVGGDWFVMVRAVLTNGVRIERTFNMAVAMAQDEEMEHSADEAATPLNTIEPIQSYRVIYTSLFTNTMPISSELIVDEYAWQEAENAYGFNSLYKLRLGMFSGHVMQEEYFIDDRVYGGMMERVGEWDRAGATDTLGATMPILTLESGNENPGGAGAYYFPMTIGEIISRSQLLGDEVVNGLLTTHYRTTDSEAIVNTNLHSLEALSSSKAQGDFWVTPDHQYVIRFVMTIEGMAEGTQSYRKQYIVSDVNQEFEIALRPDAQAQIDAERKAVATGMIPHPTCEECIFPVLSESSIYADSMSSGRSLNRSFPGHGRTLDEITTLYEQKLVELGWIVTNQDGWHVTDGTHHFMLTFIHRLDNENDWFIIKIIPDPPF